MTGPEPKSALGDLFDAGRFLEKKEASESPVAPKRKQLPKSVAKSPVVDLVDRRPDDRYVPVEAVCQRYSISRATVWRWVANDPLFPKPIKLSAGTSRWSERQLLEFETRVASLTSDRSTAVTNGKRGHSKKRSG